MRLSRKPRLLRITRPCQDSQGQGLVELTLVVFVLLVIVVGILDLGRAFFAVITLTNVSREGARYLTLFPADNQAISKDCSGGSACSTAYCCTYQAALLETQGSTIALNSSNVAVTYCRDLDTFEGCDSGFPVRVTVSYSFVPITGWVLPSSINLSRSTEMLVP
jgi:Flp pilus assembly protein TadG